MNKVLLVAKRELKSQVRNKNFVISTVIMLVLMYGGAIGYKLLDQLYLSRDSVVAVTETAKPLGELVKTQVGDTKIVIVSDDSDLETLVKDGQGEQTFDLALSGTIEHPKIYADGEGRYSDTVQKTLEQAAQQDKINQEILKLNGDPKQIASKLSQVKVDFHDVSDGSSVFSSSFNGENYFVGLAVSILLFMGIVTGLGMLMMSVVEEKSTRVVEILLSTLRPTQLLAGKILGMALTTLVYVLILVIGAIGATFIFGGESKLMAFLSWHLFLYLAWLFIGLYSVYLLGGSIAATVSRQEELGSASAPLMFLFMIPFYLGIYLVPLYPDNLVVRVCSVIPLFSPFMMPMRIAIGVSWWESALALLLSLLLIPALAWFAGRVYRNSILQTGAKVKLLQSLRNG